MIKAFIFKEWVKLRLWWSVLAVANLAYVAYLVLRLRYVGQVYDGAAIWSNWIFKGYLFYGRYESVPLLLGGTLAVLQFLPEVQNHRIRLVFHLPLGEERAIGYHLIIGAVLMTAWILPAYLGFAGGGAVYFPSEFQGNLVLTFAPWALAGYAAYVLVAALLLEASWRGRCVLLALAAGTLRLYQLNAGYEGYTRVLWLFVPLTFAWVCFPFVAAFRFRKGLST